MVILLAILWLLVAPLASRLRAAREATGRSLRDVAREAKIDPSNLSRIERGVQHPTVETLVRIGQALGLTNVVTTLGLFVADGEDRD